MRNPIDWKPYAQGAQPALLFGRGYTGHEHLNQFGLINMNARLYDPLLARFLAPDPFVGSGMTNDFNRYVYCRDNPLMYTDPSGKNILFFIGLGIYTAINYAIKVRDNHGEMNPTKWNNNSFTIGYSSSGGFYSGISFDGGYHSSNIGYSNNGLTVGSTNNGVTTMEPVDYTPKPINITVEKPKWDGKYYQGTLDEARNELRDQSHFWNIETSGWITSRGYYFDKIAGTEYHLGLDYNNPVNGLPTVLYNKSDGFIINEKYTNYRYFEIEDINGNSYNGNGDIYMGTSIFDRARIYGYDHTHRANINPSDHDRDIANWLRITSNIVHWNGNTYNYAKFNH